jgi:hypothetical protein
LNLRQWVSWYRGHGYQPLPSDPKRKKPLVKFSQWWEDYAPGDIFDGRGRCNVQVMTGRFWNLAVLDVDGPDSLEFVETCWPSLRETWRVRHDDNGIHYWFRLPDGLPEIRKRRLWGIWDAEARDGRGDWSTHGGVELLCDRSLIMSPPSIHPKHGTRYEFDFASLDRPALIPGWLLEKPSFGAMCAPEAPRLYDPVPRGCGGGPRRWQEVLDRLGDKAEIARSFGLRFARHPQRSGDWVSVHDYDREDNNPSARFNLRTGQFWRPGEKLISLFELGARMGRYKDWLACLDAISA